MDRSIKEPNYVLCFDPGDFMRQEKASTGEGVGVCSLPQSYFFKVCVSTKGMVLLAIFVRNY